MQLSFPALILVFTQLIFISNCQDKPVDTPETIRGTFKEKLKILSDRWSDIDWRKCNPSKNEMLVRVTYKVDGELFYFFVSYWGGEQKWVQLIASVHPEGYSSVRGNQNLDGVWALRKKGSEFEKQAGTKETRADVLNRAAQEIAKAFYQAIDKYVE